MERTDVLFFVASRGAVLLADGMYNKRYRPQHNCLYGVIPNVNADDIIGYIIESDCKSAKVSRTFEEIEMYWQSSIQIWPV